jgi:hypothetical protein
VGPTSLGSFVSLLGSETYEIECPKIYLDPWFDGEPPVFEGSGKLVVTRRGDFSFHIHAQPSDEGAAMAALRATSEKPYDHETAFRLRATDYSGKDWNAGWVRPRLGGIECGYWQLFGSCGSITTVVQQLVPTASVELIYSPPPKLPLTENITTVAGIADERLASRTERGRHKLQVLGSDIEVLADPWSSHLSIVANVSTDLPHPYLENWLSEPLRALKGQLIFPRLLARNFADGRAFVSVFPASVPSQTMGGCATQLASKRPQEFWTFYELYLTYIARHRTKSGQPDFDANPLTRFHDEVIQAYFTRSNWVLALCVASAIEGIAKLGKDFLSTPPEFEPATVEPITQFVDAITLEALRSRLTSIITPLQRPSVVRYLSSLIAAGVVNDKQVAAWKYIRHRVAHGNLFEPWSTEEGDQRLRTLIELLYRLTAAQIGYPRRGEEIAQ